MENFFKYISIKKFYNGSRTELNIQKRLNIPGSDLQINF